jgi:hypothetical protein
MVKDNVKGDSEAEWKSIGFLLAPGIIAYSKYLECPDSETGTYGFRLAMSHELRDGYLAERKYNEVGSSCTPPSAPGSNVAQMTEKLVQRLSEVVNTASVASVIGNVDPVANGKFPDQPFYNY